MEKTIGLLRNALALTGVLALGYWFGSERPVKADSSDVAFQMVDVKAESSLLVYEPSMKTVYVYQGATAGNSSVQCSYKYVLKTPGDTLQRVSCPVGAFRP